MVINMDLQKYVSYIKNNGVWHVFSVIYQYKVDFVIQKFFGHFWSKLPLQDIIVIESYNDFDCNGGALYNYLLENEYNKKYKIVWYIKHTKNVTEKLPYNVEWCAQYKPGIKKNYYRYIAKYFTSDNDCFSKIRKGQISIFFGHGGFGLKNCKGLMNLPDQIDYVAMPSNYLRYIFSDQLSLSANDPRLCFIGFPYVDTFYDGKRGDLHKITSQNYRKVILWMPTFRKGGGYNRQDSSKIGELGIPMIQSLDEYNRLNEFLKENNSLLILKIHPKQDLSDLKIKSVSNICVLTGETVKEMSIDNYRLMKDCDAMISDYSSAAYDFLHRNKPIAYDFSDVNDYSLGLVVENPDEYIAGNVINNIQDMLDFITDVINEKDNYYKERQELRKKIFDYYDGNNCKRAVELLELKK